MKIITKFEQNFYIYSFAHIDTDEFIKKPEDVSSEIINSLPPLDKVKEALKKYMWEGDGEFGIIWIPPFLMDFDSYGQYLWHVKQNNNGTSFIASKHELESLICFENFNEQNKEKLSVVKYLPDSDDIC